LPHRARHIDVTSAVGQGTTFHIYFPRVANDKPSTAAADEKPAAPASTGTVLLVEDQEGVRRFLRAALEKFGYRILEAGNGTDALVMAKGFEGKIDLLITDLVMPGIHGQELAERLSVVQPQAKVLFMSGYAKENIGGRGIKMTDLVYLQKPFSPAQLLAKVRQLLGGEAA
jgi:DNA-binding response OmpR family regulator